MSRMEGGGPALTRTGTDDLGAKSVVRKAYRLVLRAIPAGRAGWVTALRSRARPALFAVTLLGVMTGGTSAQHVVSGRVIEPGESTIGGARVQLSGAVPVVTGRDGLFRFADVAPGVHTLTVDALGYRSYSAEIRVDSDTVVAVELSVDPIRLDSLAVRGGDIRIRGTVTDAESGDRVAGARVFVGRNRATATDPAGRFDVRDVPVGLAVAVDVRALEYLPVRIALITERDTTFDIALERDSVAARMVDAQMELLRTRSEAVGLSLMTIDRDRLMDSSGWTLWDLLQNRFAGRLRIGCLFVDEIPINSDRRGYLDSFTAPEIQRVEVFGRGRMVRIYTRVFFETEVLSERGAMAPILYVEGTGPVQCG
jgi:hypothetical protein